MARPQHGRKPQKPWHRKDDARDLERALRSWPAEFPAIVYDGAPTPLRQKGRPRGKVRRVAE